MSTSRVPTDRPTSARPTDARRTNAGPTHASRADQTNASQANASDPALIATELRATLGPLVRRDREGPATASELAAGEGIRPQSMFTIVAALQERGLVARAPDPNDGRRIVLSLTDSGREGMHGARTEKARRLTAAIADELTPDEQRQLAAALPLLARITNRV